MRVSIRAALVSGKICLTLLLGVLPIALANHGGDVAFSQTGTGTASQTPMYTAVDLHPRGFDHSEALGVSGRQQVGVGYTKRDDEHALLWHGSSASVVDLVSSGGMEATAVCAGQQVGYGHEGAPPHALLWRGSADRVVDLHPRGYDGSEAFGTSGAEQVGWGSVGTSGPHALLWRGSAASVVDLNPRGFAHSEAHGTSGEQQVGFGYGPGTSGPHALLWRGSAASVVDLNPRGYDGSEASGTSGAEQVGWGKVVGGRGISHALLWRGSAASVVDLNPRGILASMAHGTNGEEQVGVGNGRALLWRGNAASVVDLQAFLPPNFTESAALGIDAAGDVVGWASTGHSDPSHAFLWRRNVPKPATSRGPNAMRC